MERTLYVLLSALMTLMWGQITFAASVYTPYNQCMEKCESEFTNCNENIRPRDPDEAAKSQECQNAKDNCAHECQFLPVPAEEVVPPPEEYRQKKEAQEKEEARLEEEAKQNEETQPQQNPPVEQQIPQAEN